MTPKMIAVIEEWIPEQISGWLPNDQERLITPVAFQVATLLAALAHHSQAHWASLTCYLVAI
ncbi:MAG: hypothetical protein QS721_04970 [Candidatus Endonucleobacter sp. (ex Gigantidas childressi)]|nr:hypothetical protein [Candidatus Endonucleobacter sp. (ex Gigantidas childressi)]